MTGSGSYISFCPFIYPLLKSAGQAGHAI